ncbi:hypothetical protein GQX73_g4491 [Xylaria multiplex]|uniref:Glutamyl-tRNA(Gln) amidotransferase subunit A, mitochondrial n=1 Tax=Xylaria multiplex TaxID=323545 RepID=A0A7C8N8C4_9PEZI|nr:hypothetical protein GQX73_g4491 [Xylaria multiplex]
MSSHGAVGPTSSGFEVEKPDSRHLEQQLYQYLSEEDADFMANYPLEKQKRAISKVDWRLIPMLLFLYLITYLDKTNIGNAQIEGLLDSLHMDGTQFNIAVSVFFVPYILAEVPSNMILNKFTKPSTFIGILVLGWGIIMTLTGIVKDFGGLIAVRLLLGLFEAGFFPGAILLISKWYLPNESQSRIALLYSSAASGGAFSGLLAYAIAKLNGVGGLEGWRWIFILEGLLTVVMGVACFFLLVDSPALSFRWLELDEIRFLELRQAARQTQHPNGYRKKHFDLGALIQVIKDWKIYLLVLGSWSNAVPNYALKFTLPAIITSMGFTSSNAQLLTIPPYAAGAISAYAVSTAVIVGFIILFVKAADIKNNIALCYFAVVLVCAGLYPIFSGVNAWNIANSAPAAKRAVSIGYLVAAGNIGGLVGSYIYVAKERPRYPTGYRTSLGFTAAGLVAMLALEAALKAANKRNAKLTEAEVRQKYSDEQLEKIGDCSPLFRRKRRISAISTPDGRNREIEGGRKANKASRACDLCKFTKLRCSGTIPCDRCVLRRRKCVYDAVYLRGRPPTPPPASRRPSVTAEETPMVSPERPRPEKRRDEPPVTGPDELILASTRAVTHSTEFDGAEVEGQYLDHTGLTFLHRAYRRLAMQQRRSMDPHVIPGTEPMQQLTWAGDKPLRPGTPELSKSLPPSFSVDSVRTIAQTYFETCVVTYRMFHKSTVLGWLDVVSAHPGSEGQTQAQTEAHRIFPLSLAIGNAKASILLTLMAITTLRTEKTKNRFDDAWDEEQVLPQTDHYFKLALTLTESENSPVTLESAQARLIQVLYLLQTARMNRAWYQLGAAYQVIAALGLHRKQNSWGQESANSHINTHISNVTPTLVSPNDYIALQCQLRTFWVAYSMDVYMSVVLGRPRYFHDDDINQAFPVSINDEDMAPHGPLHEFRDPDIASVGKESDRSTYSAGTIDLFNYSQARVESNMDSMIAHVKLSRIIGTISRTVYSLKSLSRRERLEAARRCGQSLRTWQAGLPPHLNSIHPSSLIPSLRRQAIALQLAYCHAVIHMNRPFLLGTGGITDEHAESTEGSQEECRQAVDESIAECIAAAHTALQTVESIASDASVVNALWWMPYVSFCALAVVYVWKIEQNARHKATRHAGSNDHRNDGFQKPRDSGHDFQNILALAERCHLLLSQDFRPGTGSSASFPSQMADSPSRRYSIILEELRLEARELSARNMPLSLQPTIPLRTPSPTIAAATIMSRHQQNTTAAQSPVQGQGDTSNTSGEATFNYAGDTYSENAADTATLGLLPMSFQEWQTSDWLGLDASAFGLYLDSNTAFAPLSRHKQLGHMSTYVRHTHPRAAYSVIATQWRAIRTPGLYVRFLHRQAAASRDIHSSVQHETSDTRLAVKDNIAASGFPTTCASRILAGTSIPFAATIVSQLHRHGLRVVEKAGMDEFGMGTHSTTSAFEVLHNAHPLEAYSAGGNTGGSVRMPAAYTKTVGFKPSYGMLSRWGVIPYANSLDTVGLLARNVQPIREAIVGLGLYREHDPRDPTSLPDTVRSRCTAQREGYSSPETPASVLKGLTFGLPLEYNIEELDPRIRQGWLFAIDTIKILGGRVVPVSLPSTRNALSAYYVIAPAEAASNLAKYDGIRYGYRDTNGSSDAQDGVLYARTRGSGFGNEVKRRILLGSYTLSSEAIDNYFIQAQKVRQLVRKDFDRIFKLENPLLDEQHFALSEMDESVGIETKLGPAQVDFLVCPTAPTTPPLLEQVRNQTPLDSYMNDVFTVPASLAGLPAISIPMDLPVDPTSEEENLLHFGGLQLIGQYWDDARLLSVAEELDDHRVVTRSS